MAVSGTTSYTQNRDQAITFALHRLNVFDITVTPDASTVAFCNDTLNLMLKHWETKGIKLWTIQELTLPLVTGQNSYVLGPAPADLVTDKPLRCIQAFIRNNSVTPALDIPLRIISQAEYNYLGSKGTTGISNSVYLEVLRDSSTLHTFLTPDTFTSTNYSIHIVVQRPVFDMTTATDNFDFPTEWLYSVGWGLAYELCIPFGIPPEKQAQIKFYRDQALDEIEGWDRENASTFFIPDQRYRTR